METKLQRNVWLLPEGEPSQDRCPTTHVLAEGVEIKDAAKH